MSVQTRIHYRPALSAYPVRAGDCPHPPSAAMSVNERIAGRRIVVDGSLCLDCGAELTGQMTPAEACCQLWSRFGWNYVIGRRLCELAKRINRQLWRAGA